MAPIVLALLPACLALAGCGRVDEIQHYQAIKLKQPEPPPVEAARSRSMAFWRRLSSTRRRRPVRQATGF